MISLYGFEYSWHRFLGISALSDPLEMIGLLIVFAILAIVIFITRQVYKMYKQLRDTPTLSWFIHYITLLFANISLIMEKLSFSSLGLLYFGYLMAIIAFILTSIAIIAINYFAFYMTSLEHTRVLTAFVSVLAAIFNIVLILAILSGPSYADVIGYEIVFDLSTSLIVYPVLSVILLIPPIFFFYYYFKMRNENRPKANLTFWLGVGLSCFFVALITEVAPFFPTVLSTPLRIFFILAALTMYICFSKPDWFKKRIGLTE